MYICVDPVNGLITIPHQKNRGPMTIQGIQFAHWGTQLIRNILTSGITAGFPVTVGKIIGMGESCWLSWGKNSWIPGELGEYCRVIWFEVGWPYHLWLKNDFCHERLGSRWACSSWPSPQPFQWVLHLQLGMPPLCCHQGNRFFDSSWNHKPIR